MSTYYGAILVAAPPTLHRQGLLALLHEACPGLTICLVTDETLLVNFLQQRAYALLVLDEAVASIPLLLLLEQLYHIRRQQAILCFTEATAVSAAELDSPSKCVASLSRNAAPTEVNAAIRQLLPKSGKDHAGAGCRVVRFPPGPPTPFSRRELEVLRLVVGDYCNQEIADRLCLSVRTVESHRRALLQKTGARTLVGLVVQALHRGWVAA